MSTPSSILLRLKTYKRVLREQVWGLNTKQELVRIGLDQLIVAILNALVGGLVKMFIHELLPTVDKALFIDTDMMFVVDPLLLWRTFDTMNSTQILLFPTLGPTSWEGTICTCTMVMNLRMMREAHFMASTLLPDLMNISISSTSYPGRVDPLAPPFGDQGLYFAMWQARPELFGHLSLVWDMTGCRTGYGLTMEGGAETTTEEQVKNQVEVGDAPEKFEQLFPGIIHL